MNFELISHEVKDQDMDCFTAFVSFKMIDQMGEKYTGKVEVFAKWKLDLMKKSEGLILKKIWLDGDAVIFEQSTMQDDLGYEMVESLKKQILHYFQSTFLK